jgi:thioredoxin
MKEIITAKEFNTIATQEKPVLLDFYADWCGPCKSLMPIVQKVADKYKGEVIVRKVNVDRFQALAQKFGVRSIPALFLLEDQKIIASSKGFQSEKAIESMIKKHTNVLVS